MPDFNTQIFGYAHSHAVMAGLKAYVKNKGSIITDAYTYIDKPGETTAFRKMLEVAKQGGHDILYVDSVKEFAGNRLADFKAALAAIEEAGMQVISLTEQDYRYHTFMTAIEVLEDLTPTYQKSNQRVAAVTMFRMGTEVPQICEQLDMKESDVYEAVASYKRSIEEMEERQEE